MSINRVTISGNLTRDAESRRNQAGYATVKFCVAVNDRRKNSQTGEWEDYANYVDCAWFGSRAEKCAGALVKGSKVCIDGKLRFYQWENEGQKRSKLEVVVNDIELPPKPQGQFQPPQQSELYADDIPF